MDDISGGDPKYRTAIEAGLASVERAGHFDREIELDYRHVTGLPRGTARAVEREFCSLVDDGVLAILGPTITDNCLVTRDLADAAQVPNLVWPGSEQSRSEWVFQYQAGSLEDEPWVMAQHLVSRGIERVAVVHDVAPTGRTCASFFDQACEAHHLKQVARIPVSAHGDALPEDLLDDVTTAGADAIVHFGMFAVRPLAALLRAAGSNLPVVCNIIGSMAQNRPEWRPDFEGWCYVDMVSDGNPTLAALAPRVGPDGPRGSRLVTGLDVGRLLATAVVNAPRLDRVGVREGLERIKCMPAAAGTEGTVMGFGRWDRAALKGNYLVMRQWVDGESVEWSA